MKHFVYYALLVLTVVAIGVGVFVVMAASEPQGVPIATVQSYCDTFTSVAVSAGAAVPALALVGLIVYGRKRSRSPAEVSEAAAMPVSAGAAKKRSIALGVVPVLMGLCFVGGLVSPYRAVWQRGGEWMVGTRGGITVSEAAAMAAVWNNVRAAGLLLLFFSLFGLQILLVFRGWFRPAITSPAPQLDPSQSRFHPAQK